MKHAPASRSRLLPGALAVCAIAAVVFGWMALSLRQQIETEREARGQAEAQAASLREEAASLRERFGELERELQAIAESGNQSAEAALRRQREIEAARTQQTRTELEYQSALATARAESENLAGKLVSLEREVASLRTELEDSRTRARDQQERLEQAQRLTEALKVQLAGKDKALASLETSYQRFKDSNQSASRQLELVSNTITGIEDINRRRAAMLEQAVRRLRDLSDSYRTVAVRIDSDPRMQGTFNAEVSRLQSGVLAVEDHVAQINTLNTQASQLERKLEQARNIN